MTVTVIKTFILFSITFFLFNKILNIKEITILSIMKYSFISFILSLITLYCKQKFTAFSYVIPFILFWISLCFITNFTPRILFTYSLACYCTVLILYSITAIFWGFLTYPIFSKLSQTVVSIFTLVSSITTFIFLKLLLKYKRITTAINNLIHNRIFNYGSILYILCLLLLTSEQIYTSKIIVVSFFRMTALILVLFLANFWWRNQITKAYREKLRLLEVKTLRAAKAENEAYILKLEYENKHLGAIIHKDNRIVSAMADSVCEYLTTASSENINTLQFKGASLAKEISSIQETRQNLLHQSSSSPVKSSPPLTGFSGIDAIISFMIKEASAYNIKLKFHLDNEFFSPKYFKLKEIDLVHMLSDTLENAIIATRHANKNSIELSFQILKGTPAISISDSGIPFEIDTYMKLGICEASTHTDEGGSGIGLIDIWSFKKKYHSSLIIEELNNSIYSKRISFLFDNKNRYLIISNRINQLLSVQTRSDLLLIDAVSNDVVEFIEVPSK